MDKLKAHLKDEKIPWKEREKTLLHFLDVKQYVKDFSHELEDFFDETSESVSQKAFYLYSASLILFITNYESLTKVTSEGYLLWAMLLISIAFLKQSWSFFFSSILSSLKKFFVEFSTKKENLLDKYDDEEEDYKKTIEYGLYVLENEYYIKDFADKIKKFFLEEQSNAAEIIRKISNRKKGDESELYKILDKKLENKEKKKIGDIYKKYKPTIITFSIFLIGLLILCIGIFKSKFKVMFSFFF